MSTQTAKNPATKKDLSRAEELMRTYAQSAENKANLLATIKNELDAYTKNMKEAEAELIEIGNRNKTCFDVKGNLELEHGYLHIAQSTVIVKGRKFDLAVFANEFPDFIDVTLKTGLIKKAYANKDSRAELEAAGVKLDTEESIQVKIGK